MDYTIDSNKYLINRDKDHHVIGSENFTSAKHTLAVRVESATLNEYIELWLDPDFVSGTASYYLKGGTTAVAEWDSIDTSGWPKKDDELTSLTAGKRYFVVDALDNDTNYIKLLLGNDIEPVYAKYKGGEGGSCLWEVDGGVLQNKLEDEDGNEINDLYIDTKAMNLISTAASDNHYVEISSNNINDDDCRARLSMYDAEDTDGNPAKAVEISAANSEGDWSWVRVGTTNESDAGGVTVSAVAGGAGLEIFNPVGGEGNTEFHGYANKVYFNPTGEFRLINGAPETDQPTVVKTTMEDDGKAQTEVKEYKTLIENTETKKSSVTVDKDGIALSHSDDEASIKLYTFTDPDDPDYKEIHADTAAEIIDEKYNNYYAITSSNNDDYVLQASYGQINPTEDAFQIRTANAYVMRQRIAVHGGRKEFIPSEYITKLKEPLDQWDAKEVLDDVVTLVQPNEEDGDLKYKLTSLDLRGFDFAGQEAYIQKADYVNFRYAEYPVYEMQFQARNDFTAVFDSSIKWIGGKAPECKAGKTYEISILNGLGIWVEFE